ncbi:hypothetical protein [Lysobacter gummosus]|uniref:hypothetical protein n=1 Tax=Lysobacter gummosus TaxID=262324 RepID=UPI003625770F
MRNDRHAEPPRLRPAAPRGSLFPPIAQPDALQHRPQTARDRRPLPWRYGRHEGQGKLFVGL